VLRPADWPRLGFAAAAGTIARARLLSPDFLIPVVRTPRLGQLATSWFALCKLVEGA
jgi:hypothetical protein